MAGLRRLLLVVGAGLVAFGAGGGALAVANHATLRAQWEVARDGGDTGASDRAYAASRVPHDRARNAGRGFGLGCLLLGLRARGPRRRRLRVACTLAGAVTLAAWGLDDGESATLRWLTALAPGAGLGLLAAGLGSASLRVDNQAG